MRLFFSYTQISDVNETRGLVPATVLTSCVCFNAKAPIAFGVSKTNSDPRNSGIGFILKIYLRAELNCVTNYL
jgi:hypothetical protein